MKLEIQREQFLNLLQHVIGVVERRQTLPILSNVLITAEQNTLTLVATDLEAEISAQADLMIAENGKTTLPARKLLDILRALPDEVNISLGVEANKAVIKSGRSRFLLATLPADELPTLDDFAADIHIRLPQMTLRALIEKTHFAMAQQDVRYYLNGMLLAIGADKLHTVATDGHRLALCERDVGTTNHGVLSRQETDNGENTEGMESNDENSEGRLRQVIVPRKGIQELMRLLDDSENEVDLKLSSNHIQVDLGAICFTSKLIDGRFPDYQRAVPQEGERVVIADRLALRSALARASILANENRGVRLSLDNGLMRIQANNPEQEEAEEELEVSYQGKPLEIGFNVTYLLDALGVLAGEAVMLFFGDAGSSCLIRGAEDAGSRYVISPMRL